MRDDLVEKNDVPANVERLSHLIDHLKEQEKSYLRFLQKMLVSLSCFLLPFFLKKSIMICSNIIQKSFLFNRFLFIILLDSTTWIQ